MQYAVTSCVCAHLGHPCRFIECAACATCVVPETRKAGAVHPSENFQWNRLPCPACTGHQWLSSREPKGRHAVLDPPQQCAHGRWPAVPHAGGAPCPAALLQWAAHAQDRQGWRLGRLAPLGRPGLQGGDQAPRRDGHRVVRDPAGIDAIIERSQAVPVRADVVGAGVRALCRRRRLCTSSYCTVPQPAKPHVPCCSLPPPNT